jgi:hypothetical protein
MNQPNIDDILKLSKHYDVFNIYRLLFDYCYKDIRFNDFNYWYRIGVNLKSLYDDEGFELFNYYSSKSENYDGREITLQKYNAFNDNYENNIGLGTIYRYAREDNKKKYIKIMSKYEFKFSPDDIAEKIKELAGNRFIYQTEEYGNKTCFILYCFNGKYWEKNDIYFRQFLSDELHKYYKCLILDVYGNTQLYTQYTQYTKLVDKLRQSAFKKNIIKAYEIKGINNNICFDDKWWLFGFTNKVYDLKMGGFREYKFDDYITITTKYDWRDPSEDELFTMNEIIDTIMPVASDRNLYLELLCNGLEGFDNIIVFNGDGGNGKSFSNDLLLVAFGDYGLLANNSISFEIANLNKKRIVIFREPSQTSKFYNSIIKKLTGSGKTIYTTIICECNKKKPLFAKHSINLLFRSIFTNIDVLVDEQNYVFKANPEYKEEEFKNKYKYAFLYILFDVYKSYKDNNYKLSTDA